MIVDRETVVERPVERTTVVEGGGGGGAAGLLIGILIALFLVAVCFWVFTGHRGVTSVTVEAPKVTTTN